MRRKIGSIILAVSVLLVLTPDTVMAAKLEKRPVEIQESVDRTEVNKGVETYLEGSGSETDPYRIENAGQMLFFANRVNGVGGAANTGICAVLIQDIDLSDVCGASNGSWTPIGTEKDPYTGIFDGGSFTVSGLYVNNSSSSYTGLFGCNSGTIKNLGIADGDVAAGSYTGGLCGFNSGIITGCYNAASVKGSRYTGGICGYNGDSGSINICYNTGVVSGNKYVGGIDGYNKNMVADCYNIGSVNGSSTSIGGICGYNKKQVSNCYNTGEISSKGKNYIGSVCGYNYSASSFANCYYLITGTEKGNYGTAMALERFAAGEVCWLLNGGKSEGVVWYQTCGEGFPTFGGKTVYQVQSYQQNGNTRELVVSYTNEKNKTQSYTAAAGENAVESYDESSDEMPEESSGEASKETASGHDYQKPEWKWDEYESAEAIFKCKKCGKTKTLTATAKEKTTDATCVAEGKTVYTVSVKLGGKTYQDTKTVKIEKTSHQTEWISKIDATCEEAGVKADCYRCLMCKKYFEDLEGKKELAKNQIEEPAKGHNFSKEGEWEWTQDYSSATIEIVCVNDSNHRITLNGDITSKTTATCQTAGTTTYTATAFCEENNKEYKDTKTVDGKTVPHKFTGNPENWEWSEDKLTAAAVFGCAYRECSETDKRIAEVQIDTEDATCMVAGTTVYTAMAQDDEGVYYVDIRTVKGEIAPHDFSGGPDWKWAEDNLTATATFRCTYCGETETKMGKVEKTVTAATCMEAEKTDYTVVVEYNNKKYEDSKTVYGKKLSHDFSGKPDWKWVGLDTDAPTAIAVFTCVNKGCKETDEQKGTVQRKVEKEASCTEDGKIIYTATAKGYTDERSVDISAMHKPDRISENKPTCGKDGNIEYWECNVCHQLFGDEDCKTEISKEKTILSATGNHSLVQEEGDTYRCTECNKKFTVKEKDGKTTLYSLEDDTVMIWETEKKYDDIDKSGQAEKSVKEEVDDEISDEPALDGSQENGTLMPADEEPVKQVGEDGEEQTEGPGKQEEQKPQESAERKEQTGQEESAGQSGQTGREETDDSNKQDLQTSTEESIDSNGQDAQPENEGEEDSCDYMDENGHYDLVYPSVEEKKADSAIEDSSEEGIVNLRVQSHRNSAAEKEEEHAGTPVWTPVVVLAVLMILILLFFLSRKES